jgi:hypothetical protein
MDATLELDSTYRCHRQFHILSDFLLTNHKITLLFSALTLFSLLRVQAIEAQGVTITSSSNELQKVEKSVFLKAGKTFIKVKNGALVSSPIAIVNPTNKNFVGKIALQSGSGLKLIGKSETKVKISASHQFYIPIQAMSPLQKGSKINWIVKVVIVILTV